MRSPRTPQQRRRCQIKGSAKVENGHIFHSLLALHHSDSPSCHEIGEKEDVNKKKEGTPVQKRRVKKVEHGKSLEPNVFRYIAPAVEAEHDDDIAQEMPRPNGPPHSEPLPRKKPQRPAPNPPSYNTPSTPLTERQALQRYRRIERQRELSQSTDQTIKKTEKKLYHAKSQVFSARLRVISQAERLSKQEARISHVRNHSQNELTLELLHQDDQNDEHQQQIEKKRCNRNDKSFLQKAVQFSGPILEEFIAGLWIAMRCEIVQVQPHTSLFRVFRVDNQLPGPVSTIDLSIHVYKGTAFSLGHRHFRARDTSQRNIWLDAFIDAGATPITNCPVDIHTFLFGNCAPIYDLVFPASHYSQEGNYVSEDHQTHSLPQVQSQVDNKAQIEEYDPLAAKERIERRQLQAQDRAEFLDAENEVDRQKQKQIELKQIQAMKRAESEQAQEQIERKYFESVTENEMRSKKEAESESDKTVANKQKEVTVQRRLSLLQRVQAIEGEHFEQRQADSPKKVVKPLSQVDQEFLKSKIVQGQTQAELQKLKQAERVRAEIAAKEETERQKERAEIAAKEEAERQKERAELAAKKEAERQKERAEIAAKEEAKRQQAQREEGIKPELRNNNENTIEQPKMNAEKEVTVQRRSSVLQRVQAIEGEHFEQRQADSPTKVVKPLSQVDQEFLKSKIVQGQTQAELQKLKQAERVRAEIAAKEETERQKERAEIAAKEEAERQKERAEIAANEEAERRKELADVAAKEEAKRQQAQREEGIKPEWRNNNENTIEQPTMNAEKEVTVQRRSSVLQRVQAIEGEHFEQRQADSPKKVVKPLSQVDQEFLKSKIVQGQTQAELQKLKQAERARAEIAAKEETERQKERAEIAAKEEAERQKERAELAAKKEAERQKELADVAAKEEAKRQQAQREEGIKPEWRNNNENTIEQPKMNAEQQVKNLVKKRRESPRQREIIELEKEARARAEANRLALIMAAEEKITRLAKINVLDDSHRDSEDTLSIVNKDEELPPEMPQLHEWYLAFHDDQLHVSDSTNNQPSSLVTRTASYHEEEHSQPQTITMSSPLYEHYNSAFDFSIAEVEEGETKDEQPASIKVIEFDDNSNHHRRSDERLPNVTQHHLIDVIEPDDDEFSSDNESLEEVGSRRFQTHM